MSLHGPISINAEKTRAALAFARLIPALRRAFIAGADVPLRHRHTLQEAGGSLLLMPAWQGAQTTGVKIVTVYPQNGRRGLNSVFATYVLMDGETGRHLAIIDGHEITIRRTAAASALAGDHLARPDAKNLLIVGSGQVAALMADAWRTVRPIEQVRVWNLRPRGANALAAALVARGFNAEPANDLEAAVREADIISCATLSTVPLVEGAWLRPGAHLDLIGSFRPDMRETDDAAINAARVFIDTEAALTEAGDITQPIAAGAFTRDAIAGSLFSLCRGQTPGRGSADEITIFKSVGSALEDLAAANLVYQDFRA